MVEYALENHQRENSAHLGCHHIAGVKKKKNILKMSRLGRLAP